MDSVSELTKWRCEWGNDLENREPKLEEDTEDRFRAYKFENRRTASKIGNQSVILYNHAVKNSTVMAMIIKAEIMERRWNNA